MEPKLSEYQQAIKPHREKVLKKAMELVYQIWENENVIKLKETIKKNENIFNWKNILMRTNIFRALYTSYKI